MKVNDSMVKLSSRLRMIAQQVLHGSRVADIGSDHALLPVYLAQQGIIVGAIAGELNEGPYLAACKQVQQAGVSQLITVRHGDGLSVIQPNEVDTIVIAGMGGSTMVHILETGKDRLTGVKRIIVQPNVGEPAIREWFLREHWLIEAELILEEDGLIYEILVAVVANTDERLMKFNRLYEPFILDNGYVIDSELQKLLGPYLVRESTDVFRKKWKQEISKREWIIERLGNSEQAESLAKKSLLENEIKSIRSAALKER